MGFPKLCARAHLVPTGTDRELSDSELTVLICSDCPFYKEGQDEELECGAFNLLSLLLRKKVLTPEQILHAVRDEE